MVEEDERLNKVKIAKTKKIRLDANDVAQKELCVCVCVLFVVLDYSLILFLRYKYLN